MDKNQVQEDILTALFSALTLQHRRQILTLLMSGEQTLRDLNFHIHVSEPGLYGYLRTLQDVGLIRRRKEGMSSYYSLATSRLRPFLFLALELAGEVIATKAQQTEIDLEGLGGSEV